MEKDINRGTSGYSPSLKNWIKIKNYQWQFSPLISLKNLKTTYFNFVRKSYAGYFRNNFSQKKKSFLFLWTRDEKEHTLIFQAVFGKTIKINSFAILLS